MRTDKTICILMLALAALISGCASLPSAHNTRIDLSSIDSSDLREDSVKLIAVMDKKLSSRSDPQGDVRFVNQSFEPPLLDVLARRLSIEKLPRLVDAQLLVQRAHVDAYVLSNRGPAPLSIYNPKVSLGTNIVVDLATLGVVSLLAPGDKVSLIATLELRVGGSTFYAQGGTTTQPRKLQEGMVRAVQEAIDNLVLNLRNTKGTIDTPELTEPPVEITRN